jgi:hypothetical protein
VGYLSESLLVVRTAVVSSGFLAYRPRGKELCLIGELQPQDIEDLLQELEGASSTQVSHPQDVEELLYVLQSGSLYLARQDAAEQLGKAKTSGSQIIRALAAAQASDAYPEVRRAAAKALRGPVHQEYLGQRPDLMEVTERVLQQAPGLTDPASAGEGRLALRAKRLGIVNAVLCGLLILAMVATLVVVVLFAEDEGSGMFFVVVYFGFIPVASIPVGLLCLVGAVFSRTQLRRHSSPEARLGLRLSKRGPTAVIACYVIIFGIYCILQRVMAA